MTKAMSAMISGATSSLGAICVNDLRQAGWDILTCGRRIDDNQYFDFENSWPIPARTYHSDVDVFIHFAAATEVLARNEPLRAYQTNVLGTRRLLDFCTTHGIDNFIFVSTRHVFGKFGGYVNEETVPEPLHHYGMSKLLAEEVTKQATHLNTRIFRISNSFGLPADVSAFKRWSLIPYGFCQNAVQDGKIILNTSGLQPINLVPTNTISQTLISFEDQPTLKHIISAKALTVRDFAYLVAEVVQHDLGINVTVEFPADKTEQLIAKDRFLNFGSKYKSFETTGKLKQFISKISAAIHRAPHH